MNIAHNSIIGIDVSKNSLDICIFNHQAKDNKRFLKIHNSPKHIKEFIRKLPKADTAIILEPTGGYEKPCVQAFLSSGFSVYKPSALQVRTFAKGCGIIAKNDKIDAEVLVDFALKSNYNHQVIAHSPEFYHAKELLDRKEQLIQMRKQEKNRLDKTTNKMILKSINKNIHRLTAEIVLLEREVQTIIDQDPTLDKNYQILQSIPGVGETTAMFLLFHFPQLGSLSSRQAASLAGLAPFTRDSGNFRGRRHIYGGRKNIRNKLYMCVLSAIKRGSFKALYDRLSTKGKPYKVKAASVMRKIILLANTLISKGEFY